MKSLAIVGASGHGKVVADAAERSGWSHVVFFDDAWPRQKKNAFWHVEGDMETLLDSLGNYDGVVVAIGNNKIRIQKQQLLLDSGAALVSIVHPSAVVDSRADLGVGSVVMACAVINIDAYIGAGCIVNTGATIDHDCHLGKCVHISPGAHLAGGVTVGEGSWIGIGASIRELISIGSDVVVGAGAAVVDHIPDECMVTGVPARVVNLE